MENEVKEAVETEERTSHHHHHHHSHHHHKSSRKKKFSLKRFLRKHKTAVRATALVLVMVLTVTATVLVVKSMDQEPGAENPTITKPAEGAAVPEGQLAVTVTRFDDPVTLHHEAVSTYLSTSISVSARDILSEYQKAGLRLDQGQPVQIAFDVLGLAEDCNATGFRVEVAEPGKTQPILRKDCAADEKSVLLYNLKTGVEYRYTVRADFDTMDSVTVSGSFQTATGPRLMYVDGVANFRDFGGWKVAGGQWTKQGLLYRGTELDGAVEEKFSLTDAGLDTMLNELGIRTEIDLRETETRSEADRLGPTVNAPDPYNAPLFDAAFTRSGETAMKRIFKDLANPDNYPIYVHCTYGRDRTGTVCLILGALLGMEEESLIREYGLSATYYGGTDYANAYKVLDGLEAYGGDTLMQQAENYLQKIGLTADQIASLREIYLG